MNETLRKAGLLQSGSLCVFLAAAVLSGLAFLHGNYALAAVNGALMIANFILYQRQSDIIRRELARPH